MSLKMLTVSLWHNAMLLFSYKPHRKSVLLEATYSDRHLNTHYMSRESQTTRNVHVHVLWSRASVCLSVWLSAAACLHYCTDPDVTCRSGRGCPSSSALLGGFAIGARVALLWQHYGNAWQSPAVIRQAHRTPHAHYACRRRLPSPAIKSTRLLRAPFHFVHTTGVL